VSPQPSKRPDSDAAAAKPMSRGAAARAGRDPIKIGAIFLVVVGILVYLGFTKHIPFTHGYRVKAVFASAVDIRSNSPVRIAGVNVGTVKSIARYPGSNAAIVTMELNNNGLPIHTDATLKIRPRIFLEGNFFVDLHPGSPSAPVLKQGGTIPITQTSDPVQLDQVLTALQSDTRYDLQQFLAGFGQGLYQQPTAAQDANQDPLVRGKSGAAALNQSYTFSGAAFRDSSLINDALQGTATHDLSRLVAGFGRVTAALSRDEGALQGFVSNFDTTLAAFASQSSNLSQTIQLLPGTLQQTQTTLATLNASFPPTRAFALEIIPGVKETPATIDAAFPWIAQARGLLSRSELGGLSRQLRATVPNLGAVTDLSIKTFPQADLVAKCLTNVLLPAGNVKLNDGPLSTGKENYKEFWYTLVGLAGEAQNFDGSGGYVRFQPGGGLQTVSLGPSSLNGETLLGNTPSTPLGTRPAFPGHRPPYRPDVPCYTQKVPDLNGALANGGAADAVVASRSLASLRSTPTGASSRRAGAAGGAQPSLAAELASRLDPFRGVKRP
jgi:phospholipid/cholesterol/gamma-HCH transport system substrate-binding protein